jgi:mannitol-1-/sugar-/sorbitol-6-phosphatase
MPYFDEFPGAIRLNEGQLGKVTTKNMATTPHVSSSFHVRGILFDMDGVLINSTAADERSWRRWARFHGMEESFSVHSTHGIRSVDVVRALRPDLDPLVEARRLEEFDAEDLKGIFVLPGTQQLIASLPAGTWTIATSASERLMRRRLHSVGISIPRQVITADQVNRGKPHPEPFENGARILGLAPSDCLVIEDAPSGIEAGKAAGCKVLAVLSSHEASELAFADWIVPSLEHVHAFPASGGAILIRLTPS